jgi:heptosyltransferase-1
MKILVVKPAAFGDILHCFYAISDIKRYLPGAQVFWYVDKSYQEVPCWNKDVDGVISVPRKKIRKLNKLTLGLVEYFFIQRLKKYHFDVVVDFYFGYQDAKFLNKLGVPIVGPTDEILKELKENPKTNSFYSQEIKVKPSLDVVPFYREIASKSLGYFLSENERNVSLNDECVLPENPNTGDRLLMFVHSTSGKAKNWPIEYWKKLYLKAVNNGYHVLLPCGSQEEENKAKLIVSEKPNNAELLVNVALNDILVRLKQVCAVVGGDTGFTHLSSLIGIPTVYVFGATSSGAAINSKNAFILESKMNCSPCMNRNNCLRKDIEQFSVFPPCYESMNDIVVWEELVKSLKGLEASNK